MPNLDSGCLCRVGGPPRTKKKGLYTPIFMGFIQLKIHYSKEYKVMVILVQGQFKAVSGQI